MPHPALDNRTPFAFGSAFVGDAELRPLFVPLVQATFSFAGRSGLELAAEQDAVRVGGEPSGEPSAPGGEVSFRFEPQLAWRKLGTDAVLLGHAHPQQRGARQQLASFRVGPLSKRVPIVGDRCFERRFGLVRPGRPAPLEPVPLVWERAFGGWDRSHADPAKHRYEPRNPVGRGFRRRWSRFEEGVALPNLGLLSRWGGRPEPQGFGFVSPGWQPRARLAGRYDARWQRERSPCLPEDLDPRFWNAAPGGLWSSTPLRGDEPVELGGVSRRGRVAFALPGLPAPHCRVALRRGADAAPALRLDTVTVDADRELVLLLWRGSVALRDGPHDVTAIEVTSDAAPVGLARVA